MVPQSQQIGYKPSKRGGLPTSLPPTTGPYDPNTGVIGYPPDWSSPTGRADQSGKSRLLQSITSPEAIAAIAMGGLGFASNMLGTSAAAKQAAADRQMTLGQSLSGVGGNELDDMRARQLAYLQSTQMDPVAQARHLFTAGVMRDMSAGGATRVGDSGVENPFTPSSATQAFMSQPSLAENAARFYGAAGQVNPYASAPDMAGMGFGAAGAARQGQVNSDISGARQRYEDTNAQRRADLLSGAGATQPPANAGQPGSGWHYEVGPDHQPRLVPDQQSHKSSLLRHLLGGAALIGSSFIPGLPAVVGPALFGSGLSYGMGSSLGQAALAGGVSAGTSAAGDYFDRGRSKK